MESGNLLEYLQNYTANLEQMISKAQELMKQDQILFMHKIHKISTELSTIQASPSLSRPTSPSSQSSNSDRPLADQNCTSGHLDGDTTESDDQWDLNEDELASEVFLDLEQVCDQVPSQGFVATKVEVKEEVKEPRKKIVFWTTQEDLKLKESVEKWGNSWTKISEGFEDRTKEQIVAHLRHLKKSGKYDLIGTKEYEETGRKRKGKGKGSQKKSEDIKSKQEVQQKKNNEGSKPCKTQRKKSETKK